MFNPRRRPACVCVASGYRLPHRGHAPHITFSLVGSSCTYAGIHDTHTLMLATSGGLSEESDSLNPCEDAELKHPLYMWAKQLGPDLGQV